MEQCARNFNYEEVLISASDFVKRNNSTHDFFFFFCRRFKQLVLQSSTHFLVSFPNNVTLGVRIVPDKSIGEILLPICEEQGLTQQTAEIFIKTTKEVM